MVLFRLFFAVLVLQLSIGCALRDNEYDPLSPLHKSPLLSVALAFDSSQAVAVNGDTVVAKAPCGISIAAHSNDFFTDTKQPAIAMRYYINNELQSEKVDFTSDTLMMVEGGTHYFTFTTSAENGAASLEERIFLITTPQKPSIRAVIASYDTLPVGKKWPIAFYTECSDPGLLADSLVYEFSTFKQPVHYIATPTATFRDTLLSTLFSDSESTQSVTVHLFDKLGRHDSLSTTITFSKSKQIIRGVAPVIDSIFIVEEIPIIYEERPIQFTYNVYDADGLITSFAWDFGDGYYSLYDHPYHEFKNPGDFKVTLTITDDSLNTASRSMIVHVKRKEIIKPTFAYFTVKNDSGPAPLTVTLSVGATDKDGIISFLKIYLNNKSIDVAWNSVISKDIVIKIPGTYELEAEAVDNDGNGCHETHTIIVTDPLSTK